MKKLVLGMATLLLTGVGYSQTYFSEDFESGLGNWTNVDSDGDGNKWNTYDVSSVYPAQANVATSASWNGDPLTPDNWMVSSAIDLSSATGAIKLRWKAWGQDPNYANESYSVYVGTANDIATFISNGANFNDNGTAMTGTPKTETIDISGFAGQTIYVAFRHHDVTDKFRLNIDDVKVFSPVANDLSLADITVDSQMLGNRTFTFKVTNEGVNTASNFDVEYTIAGNTQTKNVTGANVASGASYTFTASYNATAQGSVSVSANITTSDEDMSNNSKTKSFNFFPTVIQYQATDIHGNSFDLYNRLSQGQAIVLDFMASWCGPCQSSTPALSQFIENNGSGNGKVEALAISVEPTDNNSILAGLNWNGGYYAYPKFAYTASNDANFFHYADNHGFNTGYGIPFFVMICPNVNDPANSTIIKHDTGWGNGMFNAYQTALNSCPSATYAGISMDEKTTIEFAAYPNPASTELNIEFTLDTKNDVQISMLNTMGQVVSSQVMNSIVGDQMITLNVADLESGMYIVKIKTNNGESVKRVSVIK
ncbi:MAG: choice-of-anchor J domain-containing protein [Brumimicrobium sp.]|nr:choice-of-anchor J domain-containing protein [Brumimicrobium sp.]